VKVKKGLRKRRHSERSASGVKNLLPYFLIEFLRSGQRFKELHHLELQDVLKTSLLCRQF